MKEQKFLEIIKSKLEDSSYLGDDCAFLKDAEMFITQDSLIEDVHFSLYTISPRLLGRKSVCVNLSDLSAALALPEYITISLSLPKEAEEKFVSEFYRGVNDVCLEYGVKVTGGDITGSSKVMISICAIGKKVSKYLTQRSSAKKDDYILTAGSFGASAAGFHALSNFLYAEDALKEAHLNPVPHIKEGLYAAGVIKSNIAAMDSSDGLLPSLYTISQESGHSLEIDAGKIPVIDEVKAYALRNKLDYKNFVFWGGEDYALILCTEEETAYKLKASGLFSIIGRVKNKNAAPSIKITDGGKSSIITQKVFEQNAFNHFAM